MSIGRRGLLGLVSLLAWIAVGAAQPGVSPATAAVYWGDWSLGAANLDGSEPNLDYLRPTLAGSFASATCGVDVTPGYLYWAGWFGIGRVNLEGPAAPATIVPSPGQLCGVAADATHLYWANPEIGALARANPDGSGADPSFVTGLDRPCNVAIGAGHVYWMDRQGIGRANLDGSELERGILSASPSGCGLAVDSGHVYWSSYAGTHIPHAIGRANLDGSESDPAFISGLPGVPTDIAADAGHLYWTEWHEGLVFATIGRANLDGSAVDPSWIQAHSFNLGGIAVDARPTPPPLPLPSRPIHFGQIRHHLRAGAAVLDVWVPERGDLSVASPQLGWKVLKGNPAAYRAGSFHWRLLVWPGKRGRVAARLRRQLHEKGRATVTLTLSYNEEGQLPLTAVKRIGLLKTKPHTRHR